MNSATCERVRDQLPDVLAGRLGVEAAQPVLAHLAACAECAEEARLIRVLRQETVPVPAGLEARIRAAAALRPARWRFGVLRPALIAATIGAALLGGATLLRQYRAPAPAAQATAPASAPVGPTAAAPVDARALMQPLPGSVDGGPFSSSASLDDLSVEELQTLLKEMQS
jgi:hypothetical protein